jgi:hypothetical protein
MHSLTQRHPASPSGPLASGGDMAALVALLRERTQQRRRCSTHWDAFRPLAE